MKKLQHLLENTVSGLGYELVDYEMTPAKIIRVYIDKPEGIAIEDCAIVSEQLGRLFMVEELDYNRLEISSPGLERPLKKIEDFRKHIGQNAKVKLSQFIREQKLFIGTISNVEGEQITITVNPESKTPEDYTFTIDMLNKARLVFEIKKGIKK